MKKQGLEAERADIRNRYRIYKHGANKRNLAFELTPEEFTMIVKQNCTYCGAAPTNTTYRSGKRRIPVALNGIDRLYCEEGYHLGNVLPACHICNMAKNTLNIQQFQRWLDRIVLFRTRKAGPNAVDSNGKVTSKYEHEP